MGKSLDKISPMNMEALSQFIARVMDEKQLSTYEVARRATAAGNEMGHTTVHGARTGIWKYLYPSTMTALASGLGVSEKTLWDIAQDRAAPLPGYTLEKRNLTLPDSVWDQIERGARRTRRSVEQYIEALVATAEGEDVNVTISDKSLVKPTSTHRKTRVISSSRKAAKRSGD